MTEQDLTILRQTLDSVGLGMLADPLLDSTRHIYQTRPHGDQQKWQSVIEELAETAPSSHDFTRPVVRIGDPQDCDKQTRAHLKQLLLQLQPWRKGPFELFGVSIDSEWRSDRKWQRLTGKISNLHGCRVLDVGCGNGYYLWRMLGEGATLALGIDPTQLFIAQFNALKQYCPNSPAFILPLKSEEFPCANTAGFDAAGFDTVFSMGVLSHRRNPHDHLQELMNFVRPGGEVIIETLVVNGDADTILIPTDRYAKMRNVYSIPSPLALETWLQQSGAEDIQLLDLSQTTTDEQRITEWMQFESLADFLNPTDPTKTIEGHPAPQRAIFRYRRPE